LDHIYSKLSEGHLLFEVIDTGIGISQETQANLFNKFVQTSQTQNSRLGTGLGLWITKKICDRMGADIEIKSELGKGTTFTLSMKCQPCSVRTPTMSPISVQQSFSEKETSPNIMIVEDNPFNAQILLKYIEPLNVTIINQTTNGLDAVQFYERCLKNKTPLHLITMDLEMPLMDGKTACIKIRNLEQKYRVSPCAIIIVSANSVESEITECLDPKGKIRANYFLRKPVKKEDIQNTIVECIGINIGGNNS